jgi:hypothetical protein
MEGEDFTQASICQARSIIVRVYGDAVLTEIGSFKNTLSTEDPWTTEESSGDDIYQLYGSNRE